MTGKGFVRHYGPSLYHTLVVEVGLGHTAKLGANANFVFGIHFDKENF